MASPKFKVIIRDYDKKHYVVQSTLTGRATLIKRNPAHVHELVTMLGAHPEDIAYVKDDPKRKAKASVGRFSVAGLIPVQGVCQQ